MDKICLGIKQLKGRVGACEEAGIGYDAFMNWYKNKPEFHERIKKAEEYVEGRQREVAVMSVFQGMKKNWQAGAWWLERNYPKEFGNQLLLQGDDNNPITFEHIVKQAIDYDERRNKDKELSKLPEKPTE
ncbi:MAG: hypothetical protein KKH52_04500 [Nanoarchaeota archaeon]|nr:hypothetical protein [Nanoarchaeota archaeon]